MFCTCSIRVIPGVPCVIEAVNNVLYCSISVIPGVPCVIEAVNNVLYL